MAANCAISKRSGVREDLSPIVGGKGCSRQESVNAGRLSAGVRRSPPKGTDQFAECVGLSVLVRMVEMVDDEDLCRSGRRYELKPQLFL
jgi:hypothetical protein